MTCIAWDGKTLAGDRRACRGDTVFTKHKLHRVGSMLVGLAGGSDYCEDLLAWFVGGFKPEAFPATQKTDDFAVALVVDGGRVLMYDRSPIGVEILDAVCAIGSGRDVSGRDVAIGAMHMGATAIEAVEAASRWISSCGNGVDTLEPVALKAVA